MINKMMATSTSITCPSLTEEPTSTHNDDGDKDTNSVHTSESTSSDTSNSASTILDENHQNIINMIYYFASNTLAIFGNTSETFPLAHEPFPEVFYGVQKVALNPEAKAMEGKGREERSAYHRRSRTLKYEYLANELSTFVNEEEEEKQKKKMEDEQDVITGPWYKGFRIDEFVYENLPSSPYNTTTLSSGDEASYVGSKTSSCYRLMRLEPCVGYFDPEFLREKERESQGAGYNDTVEESRREKEPENEYAASETGNNINVSNRESATTDNSSYFCWT